MAQLLEYTRYLAKEIGARPAGTEEEQQAALYITEQFQKDAEFPTNIEEFTSSSNLEGGRAILALVTIVVSILAMFLNVLAIPAFILATAAAVIYILELLDRPVISRLLSRGASQNVVAKYQPNPESEGSAKGRSRKIILVAHYDTGRVTPPLVQRLESTGLPVNLICMGAMAAAAFLLLLRIFMGASGGAGVVLLNVLTIVAIVLCLLPVVKAILMRSAQYNEGANNNATGAAALLEVARRIARGSVSEADLAVNADGVVIHGEAAAYEAGLVPEGAQMRYEAAQLQPPADLGEYDDEERLLAAKAAIAALTGKPVERRTYGSVATELVNSRAHGDVPAGEGADYEGAEAGAEAAGGASGAARAAAASGAAGGFTASAGAAATAAASAAGASAGATAGATADAGPDEAEGFKNAPSWFVSAQKNAKRPAGESSEIQRSKYTEAMENAERERAEREQELINAEEERRENELRAREEEARAAIAARSRRATVADAPVEDAPAEDATADASDTAAASVSEGTPADASGQSSDPAADQALPEAIEPLKVESPADAEAADASQRAQNMDLPVIDSASIPRSRKRIAGLPSISKADEQADSGSATMKESRRKMRDDLPSLNADSQAANEAGDASAAGGAPASSRVPASRRRVSASIPSPAVSTEPAPAQHAAEEPEPVDYEMKLSGVDVLFGGGSAAPRVTEVIEPLETLAPQRVSSSSGNASAHQAASSSVEMPESRGGGFLNRLRKKGGASLEETPQEWLDVDEDFDARTVGRERGGWESFRDDAYDDYDDESVDDFVTDENEGRHGRHWQGGAFSRVQLGHVDMRSGEDHDPELSGELPEIPVDETLNEELEQIYHFRNPQFNSEIWFVAIGSDTEGHDGMKAFIDEHRNELRGSMIIEIESLGGGELSVASEEGRVNKVQASSRVKRYIRNAVATTGITPEQVKLSGTDSIASTAQKAGLQAMHLFGAESGAIASKGSADDVFENIDESLLDDHVNFVFELLKQ